MQLQIVDERYNKSFKIIENLILDLLGESNKLDVELIEDAFKELEDINYPITSLMITLSIMIRK